MSESATPADNERSRTEASTGPTFTPSRADATLADKPVPSRRKRASTITQDYGRRRMKTYPITEGELSQLTGLGLVATACFTVAGFAFGYATDIEKDLAFSPELNQSIRDFWSIVKSALW